MVGKYSVSNFSYIKKEEIVNLNRTLLYVSFGDMIKSGKRVMMRNLVVLGKLLKEVER